MKPHYNILVLALLQLFIPYLVWSQAGEGVIFETLIYEEVLAKAKSENKMVFIDAYADWCVPCKVMEEDIFPIDMVGDAYNRTFISTRLDVEKIDGQLLAARYGISTLPGLLYMTPDETLVLMSDGFKGVEELIELANRAMEPERKFRAWENRYREGDRNSEFLYSYATYKSHQGAVNSRSLYMDYLDSRSRWNEQRDAEVVTNLLEEKMETRLFDSLLANKLSYAEMIGDERVSQAIQKGVDILLVDYNIDTDFDEINELLGAAFGEEGQRKALDLQLANWLNKGEYALYAAKINELDKASPEQNVEVMRERIRNYLSWPLDKSILETALSWSRRVNERSDQNIEDIVNHAHLLEKMEQFSLSSKYMKEAYKLAKKQKLASATKYKEEAKRLKRM